MKGILVKDCAGKELLCTGFQVTVSRSRVRGEFYYYCEGDVEDSFFGRKWEILKVFFNADEALDFCESLKARLDAEDLNQDDEDLDEDDPGFITFKCYNTAGDDFKCSKFSMQEMPVSHYFGTDHYEFYVTGYDADFHFWQYIEKFESEDRDEARKNARDLLFKLTHCMNLGYVPEEYDGLDKILIMPAAV